MGGYNSSPTVASSTAPNGDFDYKMHLLRQDKMQAHVDDQKTEGFSPTYRQIGAEEGVWKKGCPLLMEEGKFAKDIYTMFLDGCAKYKDKNLQGWRKYDE